MKLATAVARLACSLWGIACESEAPGVHDAVVSAGTVPSDAAITASDSSRGTTETETWKPTPVSPKAFVSDQRWPECIHPGVSAKCVDGWCRVPSGCYIFGSSANTPFRAAYGEEQAPVTLTYDMEVMQYELTWLEYSKRTGWPRKVYPGHCGADDCPAELSWAEAMMFANILSEAHDPPLSSCYDLGADCLRAPGDRMECPNHSPHRPAFDCNGYRLPNQFEWQYFARAGTTTDFYAGPLVNSELEFCGVEPGLYEIAWYCGNSEGVETRPVGRLLANGWGLHDVLGNVFELLQTPRFAASGMPVVDPVEPDASGQRLTDAAGGNVVSSPITLRAANHMSSDFAGLRLVRTLGKGTLPRLETAD